MTVTKHTTKDHLCRDTTTHQKQSQIGSPTVDETMSSFTFSELFPLITITIRFLN